MTSLIFGTNHFMKFKIILFLIAPLLVGCSDQGTDSFVWDFSSAKNLTYEYKQQVKNTNVMAEGESPMIMTMGAEGKLIVQIKEDNSADILMTNLFGTMVELDENGEEKNSFSSEFPEQKIQGMDSLGNFDNENQDVLFDLLFPIPPNKMSNGDVEDIAISFPFNANGRLLNVEGFNSLEMIGYESVEGQGCAVLEGNIDISDLEIPDDVKGEYDAHCSGKGTYYFDTKNGHYVGADLEFDMYVFMNTEGNGMLDMYMEMKSENLINFRLESSE